MGYGYLEGKGVKKNATKAVDYFVIAANHGSAESLANLAVIYLRGYPGIEKNETLGI